MGSGSTETQRLQFRLEAKLVTLQDTIIDLQRRVDTLAAALELHEEIRYDLSNRQ